MKLSLQLQYRYLKLRTTRNLAAQGRQSSFFHHSKIMISGLKYFFSDENMFHSYQNELPHVHRPTNTRYEGRYRMSMTIKSLWVRQYQYSIFSSVRQLYPVEFSFQQNGSVKNVWG